MADFESAVLIGSEVGEQHTIDLSHPEFTVGRSRSSSFVIRNLTVSKTHCVFKNTCGIWTVCDKSSYGTYINRKRLVKDEPAQIRDGDEITFGPCSNLKYVFSTDSVSKNPAKRIRLDENLRTEDQKLQNKEQVMELKIKKNTGEHEMGHVQEERRQLQDGLQTEKQHENLELEYQQTKERTQSQEKLLEETRLLEEKLKEMQNLLEKKEKNVDLLKKQLQEKEDQRLQDLKQLQEQKDAQTKVMLEELRKDIAEREELVKMQLAREIQRLQEEKRKIENDIQGELTKKGQSAENLKRLKEELEKVKTDLSNAEGKKQCLQDELEQITKAKESAESCLKAKQDVLANLGELVEAELLCSICSELFVKATTLNCAHTFCHHCIVIWQKKENTCPYCRAAITSQNRSLVFDTFIDRMVENLSVEMKNRRQEVIESREVQELLATNPEFEPLRRRRNRSRNRSRSRSRNRSRSRSRNRSRSRSRSRSVNTSSSFSEYSSVSSRFSSQSSTYSESEETSESEYSSDESFVEGDPDAYYGGYGRCYQCGREGHWARGCPYR